MPHICDGVRCAGIIEIREPVHLLNRSQHRVVGNVLAVLAGFDNASHKDRWNLIYRCIVVFVPGHNQQAIVRLGLLRVTTQIGLQPRIRCLHRTVMHIVLLIWYHKRDSRKLTVIAGEAGERLIGAGRNIGKIRPGHMFPSVRWCPEVPPGISTAGKTRGRQALRITDETITRTGQLASQVGT